MQFGFDTEDQHAATAALCVYACWRSRDRKKFKIDPDTWGRVERAVKSCAKRAATIPFFLERLKVKLECPTINPRWARTDTDGLITMQMDRATGEIREQGQSDRREFMTDVIASADHEAVLDAAYRQTAYVILLVRDRLEREKPYEAQIEAEEVETVG